MHKRAVLRTLACAAAWAGTGLTLSACTDAKPTFNGVDITGVFDDQTRIVVEAFQRHFRPRRVDGVADGSTLRTLKRLLLSLQERAGRRCWPDFQGGRKITGCHPK